MSYYPELDSHSRDQVKTVLTLSIYATKKGIRTCYRHWYICFSCYRDIIALKDGFYKLDFNKLTSVPTNLNNLETKVSNFYVGKFKTIIAEKNKLMQ